MSQLQLLRFPNKLLRAPAQEVQRFDAKLDQLVQSMFELMRQHEGIGLAAPQLGVLKQVAVIDIEGEAHTPLVMVNPKFSVLDPVTASREEGCLSLPGIRAHLQRPRRIMLSAQDQKGRPYQLEAEGLLAICIQHEYDHLHGILFIDYLQPLKREMLLKKYRKLQAAD